MISALHFELVGNYIFLWYILVRYDATCACILWFGKFSRSDALALGEILVCVDSDWIEKSVGNRRFQKLRELNFDSLKLC